VTIGRVIDLSSNNHPNNAPINWTAVRGAGVTTVIVKATEGTGYVNPFYSADMAGAISVGMDVLAYHFAGTGDPATEARFFASIAGRYARILDVETVKNVPWDRTFLQTLGWTFDQCMTYGSASTLVDFYQQLPSMAWPAAYGQLYPGWGVLWQFTDAAQIPGITGPVDENQWHGSQIQYDTLFGIYDPPPEPPNPKENLTVTSLESGGQLHVWGVVNGVAYHWWQPLGGWPAGQPSWKVETMPL